MSPVTDDYSRLRQQKRKFSRSPSDSHELLDSFLPSFFFLLHQTRTSFFFYSDFIYSGFSVFSVFVLLLGLSLFLNPYFVFIPNAIIALGQSPSSSLRFTIKTQNYFHFLIFISIKSFYSSGTGSRLDSLHSRPNECYSSLDSSFLALIY